MVLEIGYVGYRGGRGTNETVKEALERYVGTTYTVKYHANGGTGTMSDQKVEADSSFYLSNNHFTRIGYGFKGWTRSPTALAHHTPNMTVSTMPSIPAKHWICMHSGRRILTMWIFPPIMDGAEIDDHSLMISAKTAHSRGSGNIQRTL